MITQHITEYKKTALFFLLIVFFISNVNCDTDALMPKLNENPIADFLSDVTMKTYRATFDASISYDPDGKILSYEWDFGDLSCGDGMRTFHIYTEEGTYIVKLTVTDDDEAKSTCMKEVKVYPEHELPIAVLRIIPESREGNLYTIWEFIGSESRDQDKDGYIISYEFQIYRLKDNLKIGNGQRSRKTNYIWYCREEYLLKEEKTVFIIKLDVVDNSYACDWVEKTITVFK